MDNMKQFWRSQPVQTILLSFFIVVGATLCSPIGWVLINALQTASLPESWYPVAHLAHSLSFFLPVAWLSFSWMAPVFAIAPLRYQKYHQNRRFVPALLVAWAISWSSWPLRSSVAPLRRAGLIKMTQNAKPLIRAIESYHVKNGQYPQQLNALVPIFINKIPHTGAVGYPKFEYRLPTDRSLFKSYEVRVRTPVGGINWDVFVYWPEKNYPSRMYGGGVERIGEWAYVHE